MSHSDFQRVIAEGLALQKRFQDLDLVAVGGTAAALHCRHRVSLDVDAVTPFLRDRFDEVTAALAAWEGWQTSRLNPRVLILGERHGVELGLRQQRRSVSLHTTSVEGLLIPTVREMLRVKAFLLLQRRATRDYVDVAALAERLGDASALRALWYLNAVYPDPRLPQTPLTRFAEACEAEPLDFTVVPLASYKDIRPPYNHWPHVASACQRIARSVLKTELAKGVPAVPDEAFQQEPAA